MSSSSKRMQLWVMLIGLIGVQFGLMALFVEHNVYASFTQYAETTQHQLASLMVLGLGSAGLARYGYGRSSRTVQSIGVGLLMAAYGLGFQYLLNGGWIEQPFIALEVGGVVTVLVVSVLYWYATAADSQFRTWDARAVVVFLSAVMLTVAGWFVAPILVGAAIVGFFPLMMHLFHVVGFIQDGVVQPFRHGLRLYIAIFAFYVELTIYFIGAIKRLG